MYFVVAFRAQANAAFSKKLLNPFKITSSARLTTAEILNDQKQTLSDLKIDLLSAPYCIMRGTQRQFSENCLFGRRFEI